MLEGFCVAPLGLAPLGYLRCAFGGRDTVMVDFVSDL